MEQKKELFDKLNKCKTEITELKSTLNQLNDQKEEWFEKKSSYGKDISKIIGKIKDIKNKIVGALLFTKKEYEFEFSSIKYLSQSGDLREAAANLFRYLHEFEKENVDLILAERIKEAGLGRAIMDRLKKAAVRYS